MALQLRPNCEYCDRDLPPNATDARICSYECTFCADCVETQARQCLPELRRRLCAAPDPARAGMAAGRVRDQAGAVRQAGAFEVQPRGCRRALRADQGYAAGEAVSALHVIAGAWAKQSSSPARRNDAGCASSLRSPNDASRNDGSLRRQNRPLDLAEPDAIAVALAPAAHDELSPSSRNVRLAPPGSSTGSVPFQLISSRLPRWFFSGPEMVPLPRRSPTFIAQPEEAWCINCCTEDQYMYLKLVRLMLAGAWRRPRARRRRAPDRNSAASPAEIIQRHRLLRRALQAERLQRLARHHPRADRGRERFCQERTERHIFPLLDVARAPVVEQHEAEDHLLGLLLGEHAAHRRGLADHDAHLQLEIEPLARPEARHLRHSAASTARAAASLWCRETTTVEARPL